MNAIDIIHLPAAKILLGSHWHTAALAKFFIRHGYVPFYFETNFINILTIDRLFFLITLPSVTNNTRKDR
jgi:hypothetical protein